MSRIAVQIWYLFSVMNGDVKIPEVAIFGSLYPSLVYKCVMNNMMFSQVQGARSPTREGVDAHMFGRSSWRREILRSGR